MTVLGIASFFQAVRYSIEPLQLIYEDISTYAPAFHPDRSMPIDAAPSACCKLRHTDCRLDHHGGQGCVRLSMQICPNTPVDIAARASRFSGLGRKAEPKQAAKRKQTLSNQISRLPSYPKYRPNLQLDAPVAHDLHVTRSNFFPLAGRNAALSIQTARRPLDRSQRSKDNALSSGYSQC
jgi:hypothetical protein